VTAAGDLFVVATRPTALLPRAAGWAIRTITRSPFDHAGIIVDGNGTTVEARPSGATFGNLTDYAGCRMLAGSPPGTTPALLGQVVVEARRIAMARVGYSFAGVACLGLLRLGVNAGPVRAVVGRSDDLFCSQLVDVACQRAGVALFPDGRPPMDVTPGDLACLLDPSLKEAPMFASIRSGLSAVLARARAVLGRLEATPLRAQVTRALRLAVEALVSSGVSVQVLHGTASRAGVVAALVAAAEVGYRQLVPAVTADVTGAVGNVVNLPAPPAPQPPTAA
jgi:hypothetical protein